MQETWVWSLGQEDPLEKEMRNPLQYPYLENPRNRGAWRATVHETETELDMTEQLNINSNNIKTRNVLGR